MNVNRERNSLDLVNVENIDFKKNPYAFIAPNGDVYLVDYFGHNSMAHALLRRFYPEERIPYHKLAEDLLLEKGWLRTCRPYIVREDTKEWYYLAATEPSALKLITAEQLAVVEKFDRKAFEMLLDDIACIS